MFEKGKSGNPAGRPKGSKNKIDAEIREQFTNILENRLPDFEGWLLRTAQVDPAKAMDILIKLTERFLPALSRQELTGKDGEALDFTFKFGQKPKDGDNND